MFAVVKTGGKQYKISRGDTLKVERLKGEAGQRVDLSSVLLIDDQGKTSIGTPFLEKAQIHTTILEQTRGDKIIVFKKKRRQGYRRKAGHRQDLTVLRVEDILLQGKSNIPAETLKTKEPAVKAETPSVKKEKATVKTAATKKTDSVKAREEKTQVKTKAAKKLDAPNAQKKSASQKKKDKLAK